MTPIAAEWLQEAEEDYGVAQWIATGPTAAFNTICFHCHQCEVMQICTAVRRTMRDSMGLG